MNVFGEKLEALILGLFLLGSISAQNIVIAPTGKLKAGDNKVSVSSDFPKLITNVTASRSEGFYYISNIFGGNPYLLIYNNQAEPVFYKKLTSNAYDFRRHPNGEFSYYLRGDAEKFYLFDSNFVLHDSLEFVNGLKTNDHELRILSDGSMLVIVNSPDTVDLSAAFPGGKKDAIVLGNDVVELDPAGNIRRIYRWQNYYNPEDAIGVSLLSPKIDFMHMNAIDVDNDGNLLVSNRNLCEITKINRITGETIWRLGGRNNQFIFKNDPAIFQFDSLTLPFSYQHDIRALPNGNYTLYDNGNLRPLHYSRAVEYKLDTAKMEAELVWQYDEGPVNSSRWWGNTQRLTNGNTLIGWGGQGNMIATEVSPDGTVEFQAAFENNDGNYRIQKNRNSIKPAAPYIIAEPFEDRVELFFNHFGKPVAGFVVLIGSEKNHPVPIDTIDAKSATVTGLNSPAPYFFAVQSIDSAGAVIGQSNIENVFVNFHNPGENFILNGEFETGTENWSVETVSGAAAGIGSENGQLHIEIDSAGINPEDIQIVQRRINLRQGERYRVTFEALADAGRIITPIVRKEGYPYSDYSATNSIYIQKFQKQYSFEFEMLRPTDYNSVFAIQCGGSDFDLYLDNISIVDITTVNAAFARKPVGFSLLGNYPNPFNASTNIEFILSRKSRVQVQIFNILGEHLVNLSDEYFNSGRHTVRFDASGLASGVYICKVIVSGDSKLIYTKSKKMILMK